MSKLEATVGIKNGPFKNGLNEMRSQAKAWGSDIKSTIAGAFAFGAVASFFTNFVSEMARVKDLSDRLGESAQTIQRVGNAAKLSGSDLEFIVKTLNKMTLAAANSSDKFAEAGINATEFANAGMEEKILMLAGAYEEASGSQEKMLHFMELLGPKGQDIMILLSQGVAELKKQLNDVPTVSNTAIQAMALLDDSIDSFGQHAKQSLGSVIGLLAHLGAAAAAAWQMLDGGSFSDNYLKNIENLLDQETTGGTKTKVKDFETKESTADADKKKAADAAKALDEEMLKIARSRMDAEQKIADLKREQAQFAATAQDKTKSDAERLDAAKKVLEIQQQIETGEADAAKKKKQLEEEQNKQRLDKMDPAARLEELKKQQQELNDAADQAPDKQASIDKKMEALRMNSDIEAAQKEVELKQQEGAKAQSDLEEEQNKQRLAKMNPLDRIRELKRQQKELNDAAAKDPDAKSAAEKKLEALKLNDEIDSAEKELTGKKKDSNNAAVISSSLASVGGGGRAYVGADPALTESRRQTSLLTQLVRNTTPGGGGSSQSRTSNPF